MAQRPPPPIPQTRFSTLPRSYYAQLVAVNGLVEADIGAVFFTTTPNLNAEFPAKAARVRLGWTQTALLDSHEIPVPGAPESVIRVLLLINTEKRKEDMEYVYLRGARGLRAPQRRMRRTEECRHRPG